MIGPHTPLRTIPWAPGLDVRKAMVANAMSLIGVEAADARTRRLFDTLLGPPIGGWGLDKPYGAGGVSTCSMVALGLLRRLGVDSPEIQAPYQVGTGLRAARDFARKLRPRPAWISPIPGLRPEPGDVIDLRPYPGSRDRSNHTETVIGWEEAPDGQEMIVCVAGGQVGRGGLQAIRKVSRKWTGTHSGGRPVDGWICLDLLPYVGPTTVPEGWENV